MPIRVEAAKEAMLWERLPEGKVRCQLCAHRCLIFPGKRGICRVRENRDGTLFSLVYGRLVSRAVDPIEKKPLFHFQPGSASYSIATVGCNFHCQQCQNWEISQYPREHEDEIVGGSFTPEEIVADAVRYRCQSISYTYVEPTVFFEFAYDTSRLAHERGLANVFVSNGYLTAEATRVIAPYLDAINIDIKAFKDATYRRYYGATLQPVLDTVKLMRELGIWVEVTTLIIPTVNDSEEELREIARFLKGVDPAIPWHVTRFYPNYKLLDLPPTPVKTLRRAREIGLEEGLKYVYEGNVPGEGGENTYCPSCGELLIARWGFSISRYAIKDSRCPRCGTEIAGVGL
jgi:pyruvate formate lyase activating enzyme